MLIIEFLGETRIIRIITIIIIIRAGTSLVSPALASIQNILIIGILHCKTKRLSYLYVLQCFKILSIHVDPVV